MINLVSKNNTFKPMKRYPCALFFQIIPVKAFFVMIFTFYYLNDLAGQDAILKKVNPFIGTAEHGHVYPGATVPFGSVQLSPDNGTQGWDWCSGYNWVDSTIVGFTHTHLSGTGIGDLCDILVMPATKKISWSEVDNEPKNRPFLTKFSHKNERAEPGFYEVMLENGIRAELTATMHTGIHRYSFPKGLLRSIVVDLGYALNWDKPTKTGFSHISPSLITGYRYSTGWAKNQKIYFAISFSEPVLEHNIWSQHWKDGEIETRKGSKLQLIFADSQQSHPIVLKVGISAANEEGALAAIKEVENDHFDVLKVKAQELWKFQGFNIQVDTKSEELKTQFYTALYRTQLAPILFEDALGNYMGADGEIHQAKNFQRFDIFSLWDTFRAANPLLTILHPDKINDIINSFLSHYKEYGLLPVWSLRGNETNTMTGYHAVPIIVDAYKKGFRGFDVALAYEACLKSAAQDIRGSKLLREYGYIPHDKEGQSVTKTLEYAFDDWCIAQFALELGKTEDYQYFMKRANNYKKLFNPQTGFMQAKLSDGSWKKDFDPFLSDHNWEVAEYTEGNAWQHSWFVPHDIAGLIKLHGGNKKFVNKLDSLFSVDSKVKGDNVSIDISGLIGQYAHGNEPSHHIAYLYTMAGQPWKTQKMVRDILLSQYNDQPNGLCGNEDCGQMSAWYVFSAMGFYPVNPADGNYYIGSPLFDKSSIKISENKFFTVSAENNSSENKYIQQAFLNGRVLNKPFITHKDITNGGTLTLIMGAKPNKKNWVATSR
jgi:predicted alpha-1,2-mannosidase